MKWTLGRITCIGVALILLVMTLQTISSNTGALSHLEALVTLLKPETGRSLSAEEIQSGPFHNLRLNVYGLSCVSCSGAVFYGVVNVKGIVNANIHVGRSCMIYDSREITKKEILSSVVFTAGVYMAKGGSDTVIRRSEDAQCF